MTSLPISTIPGPALTPTQLLEAQVQLLTEIKQAHELEFGQLRQQTEQLQRLVKTLSERGGAGQTQVPVTVENFNMPFMALVGFILKASLATIPAAIIFGILWFLAILLLSGVISRFLFLPSFR